VVSFVARDAVLCRCRCAGVVRILVVDDLLRVLVAVVALPGGELAMASPDRAAVRSSDPALVVEHVDWSAAALTLTVPPAAQTATVHPGGPEA
jgi:hypothetical protein